MVATVDINDVGMTAFFIAWFRDAERNRPDSLFNDPYSQWFVPDEVKPAAQRFAELCPEFDNLIRCRLLFFRELVQAEIAKGTRQIVSVGSGFDTRPAIFRADGVTFYDVDQPAVVEYKRQVLESHDLTPWPAVACDYLDVNLPDKLQDAGFDPDLPSLFIWEGNTMYLPRNLIFEFLNQLSDGLPRFTIAFDYMSTKVIDGSSGVDSVTRAFDYFYERFTPFITGFDDPVIFERNTRLKIRGAGPMADFGARHAPRFAESLEPLADLYHYCILSK
jgi:methyltransferase (TIGR00027 family)